jgi:hypothetical protein
VIPVETEVTIPLPKPTVATEGVPLVQLPPAVAFESAVVSPRQISKSPVIGGGAGLTVTMMKVVQPPVNVYLTVSMPMPTPVTTPVAGSTIAAKPPLVHVPPETVLLSVTELPSHKLVVPEIIPGNG